MRNQFIPGILTLCTICLSSCNKMETDASDVRNLKLYNLAVQKVKKVHEFYALIDSSEIIFLDDRGEKKFTIADSQYRTDSTFKFKFTDVVGHPNGDIYVMATEIQKNKNFWLYIIRINHSGQLVWDQPKILSITKSFEYEKYEAASRKNLTFTNKENGYVLATIYNNDIVAVVNYQEKKSDSWRYRLISFSENGDVLHNKDFVSDKYTVSWTYLIDILPDNKIVTVRGGSLYLDIIIYDPVSFVINKVHTLKVTNLNYAIFTKMLWWNAYEVVFTGHADRRNNPPLVENFDVFCLKYNFQTDQITDSLFSGRLKNNELCYDSYLDQNKIIHCIGTRRGELLSNFSIQSSLLEVNFNLETNMRDSIDLIENGGYEGLFAESTDDYSESKRVLGYKLDISGQENVQGFFIQFKNP